jgi:hypothetical protein
MAIDYGLAWRRALLGILSQDAELKVLLRDPVPVFDNIPQDTAYPYIRIGDDFISDYGRKDRTGQEITTTIHTFDGSPTKRGQLRVNQIQARYYDLLHERELVIDVGDRVAYLIRFKDRVTRNLDGTSWHGIDRFRVLV